MERSYDKCFTSLNLPAGVQTCKSILQQARASGRHCLFAPPVVALGFSRNLSNLVLDIYEPVAVSKEDPGKVGTERSPGVPLVGFSRCQTAKNKERAWEKMLIQNWIFFIRRHPRRTISSENLIIFSPLSLTVSRNLQLTAFNHRLCFQIEKSSNSVCQWCMQNTSLDCASVMYQ